MPDATDSVDDLVCSLVPASTSPPPADRTHAQLRWPVIVGVALLAILLVVGAAQQGRQGSVAGALIGTNAPDFTLTTFDGSVVSLSDFRGRPVVINFWASWCPPCRSEAPVLDRVARAERAAGRAVFLGIDVRDEEERARRFLADFSISYPNGVDPGNVETSYHSIGLPFTVFVAADGTIARTWIGPLDEQRLATIIDEIA
jgi:cytochrome c biogenesis protein CcmG/thiol:disulfide interchange protein DsbE